MIYYQVLKEGNTFGNYNFFTNGTNQNYTVKCSEKCIILKLNLEDI